MLRAPLAFFVLAIFAYLLGATGIAGFSMDIGRILLVVFLIFAVVGLVVSLIGNERPKDVI